MRKGSLALKNSKESTEGALSLIPCSSRFSRAVNNAIFNNFVSFDPDHKLEDLVTRVQNILDEMDRQNLQSFFGLDRKEYIKFLDTANNTLSSVSGFSKF